MLALADSMSYDELAYDAWIKSGYRQSPSFPQIQMSTTVMVPNLCLKRAIDEWKEGATSAGNVRAFECPISCEIMRDPVMLMADGQTYERAEIMKWFALGNKTSPATGLTLAITALLPNLALLQAIEEMSKVTVTSRSKGK